MNPKPKHKQSAEMGKNMILAYLRDRMKEKKVTKLKMAEILGVSETTMNRYFNKDASKRTPMPLSVYLEICGALDLRPYLIPAELDSSKLEFMNFN